MWRYINKNPKGRCVGDCTVRAISTATGNGWMETYLDLCLFGLLMGDMPSANSVTTSYLRDKGFRRRIIPDDCPDYYTIDDFCKVWKLIDELVEAVKILHPRMYTTFIDKVQDL